MCGKSDLVKIPQKPGGIRRERDNAAEGIPNGQGSPNELIPAWGVHGIYAHVAATQAHRPLMREGSGRIVLWHHQAMSAYMVHTRFMHAQVPIVPNWRVLQPQAAMI